MRCLERRPARLRNAIAVSIVAHVCGLSLLAVLCSNRESLVDEYQPLIALGSATAVTLERAVHPQRHVQPTIIRPRNLIVAPKPQRAIPARHPFVGPHVNVAAVPAVPAVRTYRRTLKPSVRSAGVPAAAVRASAQRQAQISVAAEDLSTRSTRSATLGVVPAVVTPPPSATPTSTPTPSPAPTTAGGGFGGLFSQDYPPALAQPSDLAAIRARFGGHVRIAVAVDETGHAVDLRFVMPIADAVLAQQLRIELLALRYIPADCNGLHCDGTLELSL